MKWAVTWDVGERGPAISLNGFKWLQIIQTKRFFNTVKNTGPCLNKNGPAENLIVFEKLHTIQANKSFNTWNELDRVWSSTTNRSIERCWQSSHNQTKRSLNTVNKTGPCLGKHGPAINSNDFEKLNTMQTRSVFDTVKWAGPCLGKHVQPFIWTLLTICIISPQKKCQRREMSWAVTGDVEERGPAINLKVFNRLHNIKTKRFFNTVKKTGPVWGSTAQPWIPMFLKYSIPFRRKNDSTP